MLSSLLCPYSKVPGVDRIPCQTPYVVDRGLSVILRGERQLTGEIAYPLYYPRSEMAAAFYPGYSTAVERFNARQSVPYSMRSHRSIGEVTFLTSS